jgi:hypothetical protein
MHHQSRAQRVMRAEPCRDFILIRCVRQRQRRRTSYNRVDTPRARCRLRVRIFPPEQKIAVLQFAPQLSVARLGWAHRPQAESPQFPWIRGRADARYPRPAISPLASPRALERRGGRIILRCLRANGLVVDPLRAAHGRSHGTSCPSASQRATSRRTLAVISVRNQERPGRPQVRATPRD